MALIEMRAIRKQYVLGETKVEALRGIDLDIAHGEFVAIWGPSGSGKTTVLNLIGLIDHPTSGSIAVDGRPVLGLSDDAMTTLRNRTVGFIFQNFNLVPVLTALENVMLPLQIRGESIKTTRCKAAERLEEVGLGSHIHFRPDKLSGGQRQRVAIARALVTEPSLVIADEPTANLDSETSRQVVSLMRELNKKNGTTFIFSTHDPRLLDQVKRLVRVEDGTIMHHKEEAAS